jgi:NAD-dependent DNA ligase C4 zinc finger domain
VIPKIISVVETEGREELEKIEIPKVCPSCKSEVLKDEDKVRYYC